MYCLRTDKIIGRDVGGISEGGSEGVILRSFVFELELQIIVGFALDVTIANHLLA
jgi:hypothetical protein